MKYNFYLILMFSFLFSRLSFPQEIWINEFSYNCADSSVGLPEGDEFIEIVAPVGTDMSQYGIVFFEEVGGEYFAYFYSELNGTITSTNSNAGRGFIIALTNLSHRLESYLLNLPRVLRQSLDTELYNNFNTGILIINASTAEVLHGVMFEVQALTQIPEFVSLKNLEDQWGAELLDITRNQLDVIYLPISDRDDHGPTGSISMIGTGFSRLWTATTGVFPDCSTPGALNYSQGALPVELSSFSATVLSNGVKLNWRTETETNNFGFDIERKNNGGDWVTLSFVNGNGNSNSPKEYNYIDNSAKVGKYSYRLKQIDNDGQYSYSKVVDVDLTKTLDYNLTQNFPNPFNPATSISFSLPKSGVVKLTVYNLLGQEIKTLVNGFKESGVHHVNFNAKDLNSGIYIYKIETTDYTQTRKMTLVK